MHRSNSNHSRGGGGGGRGFSRGGGGFGRGFGGRGGGNGFNNANNNNNRSVEREHIGAYSPSCGKRERYVPKPFDNARGYVQPRHSPQHNNNNNTNNNTNGRPHLSHRNNNQYHQDSAKHAPTIHGWSDDIATTNDEQDQEEEQVDGNNNNNNNNVNSALFEDAADDDNDQQLLKTAATSSLNRPRRNPTLVIPSKKNPPKQQEDDDAAVVSASTSDDDDDEILDNDTPLDEDDGTINNMPTSTGSNNLLLKVSSNCLPRRIVFQRARKPDVLPRPAKMIDLMKQVNATAVANAKKNGSNSQDDQQTSVGVEEVEIDPDDPLFAEKDFDLSANTRLPPVTWNPSLTAKMGPGGGLENVGATCFVNAVLQCYAYLPPFSQYLQNQVKAPHHHQQQQGGGGISSSPHTQDFLFMWADVTRNMMNLSSKRCLTPRHILKNLTVMNKNLNLSRQHDASEFAMALVDRAQISSLRRSGTVTIQNNETGKCDVNKATQHTTMLMRLLGGWTRSRVTWAKEEEIHSLRKNPDPKIRDKVREIDTADPRGPSFRSTAYEDFTVLGLNDLTGSTLEDCLEKFIESDSIEGFTTDRKGSVTCHKRVMIHQLPYCLTIMLGRFQMDPFTGRLQKKSKNIRFRPTLNMKPYLTEECINSAAMAEEDPTVVSGMPRVPVNNNYNNTDQDNNNTISCWKYSLCGVVVHLGRTLRGGHYIAYVKAANDLWYEADDESIRQVPPQTVFQQEAFMLFYVVDPSLMKNSSDAPKNHDSHHQQQNQQQQNQHQQEQNEDAATSSGFGDNLDELMAGMSKKEKKRLKHKLKLQQQEQSQEKQQESSSSTSLLQQQIRSTGAMMRQKAQEQEEEFGAAIDEDEVLQLQQQQEEQRRRKEEFERKRQEAQRLIEKQKEEEQEALRQRKQQQKEQKQQQKKVQLVIQQDHSSAKRALLDDGHDDDDDEEDEAVLEQRAREEHRRRRVAALKQQQQQQQPDNDTNTTTSSTSSNMGQRVRSVRAGASAAQQVLMKFYEKTAAASPKKDLDAAPSLNSSSNSMRGKAGVQAQQSGAFIQMMNKKNNKNNKQNNDDDDLPIPSDNDNDDNIDDFSPLGGTKKNTKYFSPSSSGTFVQPQVTIASQIQKIAKQGAEFVDHDHDDNNNNNNVESQSDRQRKQQAIIGTTGTATTIKGADAASLLHQHHRERKMETGAKLSRKGFQGRFNKNLRDEQYNDELDRGRIKKTRSEMTRGRDAGLVSSDVGPNRFQVVAEQKVAEKRERQDREYRGGHNNYDNNYRGGGGRGGGGDAYEQYVDRNRMDSRHGFKKGHRSE